MAESKCRSLSLRRVSLAVLLLGAGAAGVGVAATQVRQARADSSAPEAAPAPTRAPALGQVTAPGVVEPASRTVELRSQVQGRLASVAVESGDAVTKGQVLAELDNEVERAQVSLREAEVARARAALERAEAGARPETRRRGQAELARAEAEVSRARLELARVEALVGQRVSSEHARDQAKAALAVAEASRDSAKAALDELEAGERREVVAEAKAAVASAEASLQLARAQLERTVIRSPLDGRCVYRYREPGEVVGIPMEGPPLLSVAGGPLRVRVDVDARDIARVAPGQPIQAVAAAWPGREVKGRVLFLEPTLGRKNFRTDRPRERIDTKVLEVVCELEPGTDLPLGLELTVSFGR